ncbi:MAG TPA: CRISPR-associated endonuclease Cas6 [Candidatus Competibacteraceae bacterium]|nr:CRISPR-associated endonuclease Cas6 [Candidatus Competibacteraceae bacterium]HQA25963.1 CRISPR-associated endonuclease Cas6 [Candidatus Competibacteraceae bacterium]HQD56874.1 CRISPR-associated endonuclease Cas6 [Candidatus Competibacteraceae bacterium]
MIPFTRNSASPRETPPECWDNPSLSIARRSLDPPAPGVREPGHDHLLGKRLYTEIELCWDRVIPGPAATRAGQLRGALATAFTDDDLFHQHAANGQPLYRYPHVQYRWRAGRGLVIGWQAATERLLRLPWLDLELCLGAASAVRVADIRLTTRHAPFGIGERLHHYRFVSPALLFNQRIYAAYRVMDTTEQRQAERNRLLIASLLIALRGLGVHFPERLYAIFTRCERVFCRYKRQELIGLQGEFVSNAVLPDGLGIGHAVSHGYGWITAIRSGETPNPTAPPQIQG